MQQHHHLHQFDDYHYDIRTHDNYPAHHHEWAGNNHFDTVNDRDADNCPGDIDVWDSVNNDLIGSGGYDIHFS